MDKTFRGYTIVNDKSQKYAFSALRSGLCFATDARNANYVRSRASALNSKGKGPFIVHKNAEKIYVCMPVPAPVHSSELTLTFKILPPGDVFGFDHLDVNEGISIFSYHYESISRQVDQANRAPDEKLYVLRRAKDTIYILRVA